MLTGGMLTGGIDPEATGFLHDPRQLGSPQRFKQVSPDRLGPRPLTVPFRGPLNELHVPT